MTKARRALTKAIGDIQVLKQQVGLLLTREARIFHRLKELEQAVEPASEVDPTIDCISAMKDFFDELDSEDKDPDEAGNNDKTSDA